MQVLLESSQTLKIDEYADMSIDESNPPDWLLDCLKGPVNPPKWNSVSIAGEEVRTQLNRMPVSSAPGPDRLPYKLWKAMDSDGELLVPSSRSVVGSAGFQVPGR